MRYIVNKPYAWLYKTEDLTGEVSDQLLFGTVADIISERGTVAYVRTSYGYRGYINRWDLEELSDYDDFMKKSVLIESRCDLLREPRFCKAPEMSLPRGSRVYIESEQDERFLGCAVGRKRLFLPKNAVLRTPTEKSIGDEICRNAALYLGAPYRWGGKSDCGIDCSGLAFMSCLLCGIEIWRDAEIRNEYVFEKDESEIKPGDLAYFPGHVVIMTGRDTFIHASASRSRVVRSDFSEGDLDKSKVIAFAGIKKANGR